MLDRLMSGTHPRRARSRALIWLLCASLARGAVRPERCGRGSGGRDAPATEGSANALGGSDELGEEAGRETATTTATTASSESSSGGKLQHRGRGRDRRCARAAARDRVRDRAGRPQRGAGGRRAAGRGGLRPRLGGQAAASGARRRRPRAASASATASCERAGARACPQRLDIAGEPRRGRPAPSCDGRVRGAGVRRPAMGSGLRGPRGRGSSGPAGSRVRAAVFVAGLRRRPVRASPRRRGTAATSSAPRSGA